MASLTRGTTFVDGVANDVTAAKLHALVDAATPTSGLIQDRTAETSIASNDTLLFGDASDGTSLKRITVDNFAGTLPTATITSGTITTLNSTTGTITTGVIPTLTSITKITSGTGTAAAPAISPTGDTNTGIFFPAADTIAFSEGGTEAVRIDNGGNVTIGKVVDSATIPNTPANHSISLYPPTTTNNYGGGIGWSTGVNTAANICAVDDGGSGALGLVLSTGNSSAITERLRIDSSGNVGIGTTSPDALLHVVNNQNGTAAAPQFRISGGVSVYEALHYLDATAYYIAQNAGSRELRVYSGTNAALGVKLTVGATSWASISDSRSKDIIEPITNSLDKIQNINPVIGKYKNDELNTRRSFVIGQDVQEVFPESISVDSEGYISVRYSDLIPLLIGGIKELKSENDSLKSRIESLEAK